MLGTDSWWFVWSAGALAATAEGSDGALLHQFRTL